jgi:pyridoxine 5-phosphate synthase
VTGPRPFEKKMTARLNVNIDHVATVRQARRAPEPSVVAAAMICEQAGADGITVHLRGDRRHILDNDVYSLRRVITTYLNVEMAATDEMIKIALEVLPDAITLVAESPNEITTEGGLDVVENLDPVRAAMGRLREANILASLFIDPTSRADQIELCTAAYANATLGANALHTGGAEKSDEELKRLKEAAKFASKIGLKVAAGHGLTYRNVGSVAAIEEIEEFNIGHNIIARSVFAGLDRAVREIREAILRGINLRDEG